MNPWSVEVVRKEISLFYLELTKQFYPINLVSGMCRASLFSIINKCHCAISACRNQKVGVLVQKRMILEETMAWLSTLGGGYSSLGDYFRHFVSSSCSGLNVV